MEPGRTIYIDDVGDISVDGEFAIVMVRAGAYQYRCCFPLAAAGEALISLARALVGHVIKRRTPPAQGSTALH